MVFSAFLDCFVHFEIFTIILKTGESEVSIKKQRVMEMMAS